MAFNGHLEAKNGYFEAKMATNGLHGQKLSKMVATTCQLPLTVENGCHLPASG